MSKSPRASLNSPTPKSSAPSPSKPKTSTSSTPSRKSNSTPAVPRGPVPPSLETSYHKRLRSILLEHKKLRKEWNELILRGIVGRSKAVIEIWVEIENGLRIVEGAERIGENEKGKGKEVEQERREYKEKIKIGYLFSQAVKLSDGLDLLATILAALNDIVSTMNSITERVEALLVEAAKTRGTLFAFREPLWVTWPLSQFADGLADLSSHYSPSLILIRNLVDTLTTFPPLPPSLPIFISPLTPKKSEIISTSIESPSTEINSVAENKRAKAEELQACMSLLVVQPLLPSKLNSGGVEAWEEICSVEVGGWNSV